MRIVFKCHGCGREFSVPETLAGKQSKCNTCGAIVVVPSRQLGEPVAVAGQAAEPLAAWLPLADDSLMAATSGSSSPSLSGADLPVPRRFGWSPHRYLWLAVGGLSFTVVLLLFMVVSTLVRSGLLP